MSKPVTQSLAAPVNKPMSSPVFTAYKKNSSTARRAVNNSHRVNKMVKKLVTQQTNGSASKLESHKNQSE